MNKPSQTLQSNVSSPKGGALGRSVHFRLAAESSIWRKRAGLVSADSSFWTTHLVKLS